MSLPAGAIPINLEITNDAARYGQRTQLSVCKVFGHRAIAMRAHPETAAQYGLAPDTVIGDWCAGCGSWL